MICAPIGVSLSFPAPQPKEGRLLGPNTNSRHQIGHKTLIFRFPTPLLALVPSKPAPNLSDVYHLSDSVLKVHRLP